MQKLSGQVVWVTGASTGIGAALARELAARGARVALTARSEALLRTIEAELTAKNQVACSFPGDVTDLHALKQIATEIENRLGPIEILVANAGTHIFSKPLQFNSKEYLDLINLNLGGVLHAIEAVLPKMQSRGHGYIVGMASLAGFRGLPRAAAYGASKAAIIHFLESARFHLREAGIDVTIVNPGFVKTPLTDKNDFHMPFLVDAARAARIICEGMEARKKEISFPIPFNWFLKLMRIIPYPLYEWLVTKTWKRMTPKHMEQQ